MGKPKSKIGRTKYSYPKLTVTKYVRGKMVTEKVPVGRMCLGVNQQTSQQGNSHASTTSSLPCQQLSGEDVIQPAQATVSTSNHYEFSKRKEVEDWIALRKQLSDCNLQANVPSTFTCTVCSEASQSIARCLDCGPQFYACLNCMTSEHTLRPLHDVKVWQDGWFQSLTLLKRTIRSNCRCYRKSAHNVTIVNNQGLPLSVTIDACSCCSLPEMLVVNGIWPATPSNTTYAFTSQFLSVYDAMLLEGHISAKAFINSFAFRNRLEKKETNHMYKMLMTECLEEYKQMRRSEFAFLHSLDKCPACPSMDAFFSMDANFGLVHKRSAGKSYEEPKHPWEIFVPDAEVTEYLHKHGKDCNTTDDCNSFQAGSKIRSKIKNTKLDVTGLFTCICRHEIPVVVFNMCHGERLAYPSLAVEKTLEKQGRAKVLYDIACVLEKYLVKYEDGPKMLEKLQLAIPAFHVYGHKSLCHIKYSPSKLDGFGMTDGEGTERLWSYLRPFSKITKEMTPAHRQDLIVDALQYYSVKKKENMVYYLMQRYKQAQDIYDLTVRKGAEICEKYGVQLDENLIRGWEQQEREFLQVKSLKSNVYTWQEKYVSVLLGLNRSNAMSTDDFEQTTVANLMQQKEMKCKLLKIENKHKISERWKSSDNSFVQAQESLKNKKMENIKGKMHQLASERKFLVSLMRKYADGQAIAKKLSKQITAATQKISKLVLIIKDLDKDNKLTMQQALDPDAQFYQENSSVVNDYPDSLKKEAIELMHKGNRALEEKILLEIEMGLVINNTISQYKTLSEALISASDVQKALICKEQRFIEKFYDLSVVLCKNVISDIPPLTNDVRKGNKESPDLEVEPVSDSDSENEIDIASLDEENPHLEEEPVSDSDRENDIN